MTKVKTPDGAVLNFPQGVSPEEMQAAIQKYYNSTTQPNTPKKDNGSFWEGYGNSFAKLGVGAKQRVLEIAQSMGSEAAVEELTKINDLAKRLERSSEGRGVDYNMGDFTGSIVPALASGGGGGLLGAMGVSGATSALQEFIQPNTQDMTPGESLAKKTLDAGISGAVGAASVPAFKYAMDGLASGAKALASKILPDFFPSTSSAITPEAAAKIVQKVATTSPEVAQQIATESPDVISGFAKNISEGLSPEQAAFKAKADAYGVRVSKGDVTRNMAEQGQEEAALKGMYGNDSQVIAQSFREGQNADFQNMSSKLGQTIGKGEALPETVADVGERINASLKQGAAKAKAAGNKAYNDAGLNKARAPMDSIVNYRNALRTELNKEAFNDKLTPTAHHLYTRVDDFVKRVAKKKTLTNVNLQHLEGFRKAINNAGRGSNDADTRMLGIMRDSFDNATDDALENGLIMGNTGAIDGIKNARSLWKSYKQRYYGSDGKSMIGRIVDKNYTPEKVMDLLVGTGKAGGKTEAATAVSQLQEVLGKDSSEMNQLRQAMFKKLVGNDLGSLGDGDLPKAFSGKKFYNNVNEFVQKNKSLADALYSPELLKEIKNAAIFANRVTTKQEGVVNYSNTTPVMVRYLNSIGQKLGPAGRYVTSPVAGAVEKIARQSEKATVQKSFSPTAKDIVGENPFTTILAQKAGIASGVGASELRKEGEEKLRDENRDMKQLLRDLKITNPYTNQ